MVWLACLGTTDQYGISTDNDVDDDGEDADDDDDDDDDGDAVDGFSVLAIVPLINTASAVPALLSTFPVND